MGNTIRSYNMKAPVTNNDLTDPMEFNLMFSTSIGPTGGIKGYVTWIYVNMFSYIFLAAFIINN